MIKTLRSLILESISPELRVELDLLSRRRDLQNKEKVDKILKLLRQHNIGDFTQLGSGTNRYAIRFQGFVLKIALDNDGKVDNLSEFSWSKFLYPRVPMVHEVTENGLLLVCEYIQPFMSMAEMQKYADEIRKILKDLSAICLIGDVGIANVNYANWGSRPGADDDPVCLDFAYIYEVRSRILMCRQCSAGSILIPDDDYNQLYCPTCKSKVAFAELRSRISREEHMKEITDMEKKGYALTESKVPTELDPRKSQWLVSNKKKRKRTQPNQEELYTEIEEENIMSTDRYAQLTGQFDWSKFQSITATAQVIAEEDDTDLEDVAIPTVVFEDGEEEPEIPSQIVDAVMNIPTKGYEAPGIDDVLASYHANSTPKSMPAPKAAAPVEPAPVEIPVEVPATPVEDEEEEVVQIVPPPAAAPVATERPKPASKKVPTPQDEAFTEHFLTHSYPAISKISQKIGSDLEHTDIWEKIQAHISEKKVFRGNFFERVQNAVCYSLLDFSEFTSSMEEVNGRRRRVYTAPDTFVGKKCEPSMIFLGRYWNSREINALENPDEIMPRYRELYPDYQGLQLEWSEVFIRNLRSHCKMDDVAKQEILRVIQERWCVPAPAEVKEPDPEPSLGAKVDAVNAEVVAAAKQIQTDKDEAVEEEGQQFEMSGTPLPDGLAFSSESSEVKVAPVEEEESEVIDEDRVLNVIVDSFNYHSRYAIYISNYSSPGRTTTPIYLKHGSEDSWTDLPKKNYKTVYRDNGIWDWLSHFQPDMVSSTTNRDDVERLLSLNPVVGEMPEGLKLIHIVIGKTTDDKKFWIGSYFVGDLIDLDADGESYDLFAEDLDILNSLIMEAMDDSPMSHRVWNVKCAEPYNVITVDEVLKVVEFIETGKSVTVDGSDQDGEAEEDEEDEFSAEFAEIPAGGSSLSAAAEAAMAAEETPAPVEEKKVYKPRQRIREEDRQYPPATQVAAQA